MSLARALARPMARSSAAPRALRARRAVEALLTLADLPAGAVKADFNPASGVTMNGASVSSWAAETGAFTLSQATAAKQPAFAADGWAAAVPSITSDGVDDVLTGDNLALSSAWIFHVAERGFRNATSVLSRPILQFGRGGDGYKTVIDTLRSGNDAENDDLRYGAPGGTGVQTNQGYWPEGQRSILVQRITSADHTVAIDGALAGTPRTNNGTVTLSQTSLFGDPATASANQGMKYARLLAVDYSALPGGKDQLYNRYLIEGYLAHQYGTQGRLPASHPFKSAAPKQSAYTGLNMMKIVFGNSLGFGMGQQLGTASDADALGLPVQNGGVGGETSYMMWYRLKNGFDNRGSWGTPLTTGNSVTAQCSRLVVIGDVIANDPSESYPLGVSSDTTPETTATPGSTPGAGAVGTTWGNLNDMIAQVEARQGVGPGEARLIAWPFWEGNGLGGFNQDRRDLNDEFAALYPNYALNMNYELWKLGAPGGPYEDADAYAAGVIPAALRAAGGDATHLNDTGYLEASKIVQARALANRWTV